MNLFQKNHLEWWPLFAWTTVRFIVSQELSITNERALTQSSALVTLKDTWSNEALILRNEGSRFVILSTNMLSMGFC